MRIQSNIAADNSQRQLGINTRKSGVNMERLSSGFRVNRAADDAAGLAISEKMRTQIKGLNRASLNVQDGISLLQVGDGALQSVQDKMQRLRELAVQAANDTNQVLDRAAIQLEFGQLTSEINQDMSVTNFNGRMLFDGSIGASFEYNLGQITTPYLTTIPAGSDFASPTSVASWTPPATFGVQPAVINLGSSGFPTTGIFAMQIVTPADGTLNVILDFATENSGGTMNLNGFLTFFKDGFNNMGLGHIVDDVRYVGSPPQIIIDFPKDGTSLTGIMGKPGTGNPPRVLIGVGSTAAGFGSMMRDSLNGIQAPLYTTPPIRSNRSDIVFSTSTVFANMSITGGFHTLPPNPATPPPGGFANATINISGNITTISLLPGSYPDAQSFVDAHKSAFAPLFELDIDADTGRLVITTKGMDPSPAVGFTINPPALATALGFGGALSPTTELPPGGALWIQSGANSGDGLNIEIPSLTTRSLGLSISRPADDGNPNAQGFTHINGLGADGYTTVANVLADPKECSLDVTSHEKASASLSVLTNAINIISIERARMGAQQNRLEFTKLNAENSAENLQAAETRIRDVDMAAEMTVFVKNQILTQSGTAMLAQANTLPQGILQLLS